MVDLLLNCDYNKFSSYFSTTVLENSWTSH